MKSFHQKSTTKNKRLTIFPGVLYPRDRRGLTVRYKMALVLVAPLTLFAGCHGSTTIKNTAEMKNAVVSGIAEISNAR